MIRVLSAKTLRAPLALVMVISWLVLSNHCALGAMAATPSAEHAGCCGQPSPGNDGQTAPVRDCCLSMRAVNSPVVAVTAPAPVASDVTAWLEILPHEFNVTLSPLEVRILETGPPEARSFAELVLQQGVRAHAPPILG